MSYEGREFILCEDGHLVVFNAYELLCAENDELICEICSKRLVWAYPVDDTNGEGEEPDLPVLEEEELCKCRDCNVTHVKKEARYERIAGGYCLRSCDSSDNSDSVAPDAVYSTELETHIAEVSLRMADLDHPYTETEDERDTWL